VLPCIALQTEGESAPLKFSQVFHLMPVNNSFVVTNGEQHAWCAVDSTSVHCSRRQQYCCWLARAPGYSQPKQSVAWL
jgi:hypothetical protein